MEQYPKKLPPQVDSRLRHSILEMPVEIRKASGIVIYGRRIKSLVFTTDLAIIKQLRRGRGVRRLSIYAAAVYQRCDYQSVLHPRFLRRGRRNDAGASHRFAREGCRSVKGQWALC